MSTTQQKEKTSAFNKFTEIMGWLQIVASPLLIGAVIGLVIYLSDPNAERLVIAIIITVLGLIIGIIWATRVWKKKGTMHYMSRIMASPELDNKDKQI